MSFLSIEFGLCFTLFFIVYWSLCWSLRAQNDVLLAGSYGLLASFSASTTRNATFLLLMMSIWVAM